MLDAKGVVRDFFTDAKTGIALIDVQKVYSMARKKEIPHIKIGRKYFFNEEALDMWSKGEIEADEKIDVLAPIPE